MDNICVLGQAFYEQRCSVKNQRHSFMTNKVPLFRLRYIVSDNECSSLTLNVKRNVNATTMDARGYGCPNQRSSISELGA